jgi:hypothetical protein
MMTIGVLYILLSLIVNELTIASWVGVDRLGPYSRQVILALDLAAITWGVLTIHYRRRTLIANMNVSLITTILLALSIEGCCTRFRASWGRLLRTGS